MSDDNIRKLTQEEIDDANRQAEEFLKQIDAAQAANPNAPVNMSDKFAGPIGQFDEPENGSVDTYPGESSNTPAA